MRNIRCSDALITTKWMLRKSGIWPLKKMNFFDKIKLIINWAYALSLMVMVLFEAANIWRNYQKLAEILCTVFPSISYLCKLVALVCKKKHFFAIIDSMDSTIFNSHPEEQKIPIIITIKVSRMAAKVFRVLIVLLIMLYLIFPILDHNALPIPISFKLGNYFYLMHFYQMSALILIAWNITCIDLLFTTFTGLAAAQIDILERKLLTSMKDIGNSQDFNQSIASTLRSCIQLHVAIIR